MQPFLNFQYLCKKGDPMPTNVAEFLKMKTHCNSKY